LWVSAFDAINGNIKNVTVAGFINITNFNASLTKDVRLSRFLGNIIPRSSGNLAIRKALFTNLSSALQYYVNNQPITADNTPITSNGATANIRLINGYDETCDSTNLPTNVQVSDLTIPVN
jgi:hypothetical protein